MGIFSGFFNSGKRSKMTAEGFIARWLRGEDVTTYGSMSKDRALTEATVYACVRLISEATSMVPLSVYKRNGREIVIADHPLNYLFNHRFNEYQTAFEGRQQLMSYLLLTGDYFGFKKFTNGVISSIYPLDPERVVPYCYNQQKTSYSDYLIGGKMAYQINTDNFSDVLLQDECLHIKGLSLGGLKGASVLSYHASTIGLGLTARDHGINTFRNGASPSGILEYPGKLSPEGEKNLLGSFSDAYQGTGKVGRVILVQEGTKFTPATTTNKDAQHLESRAFQKKEICAIFGVPPHLVGDLERATFSNIEQQSKDFVMRSLAPWFARCENVFNTQLLTEAELRAGYFCRHNVIGLLRGDEVSRANYYSRGILDGWMTRNEAREMENLNPIDGADSLLAPLNMAIVGEDEVFGDASPDNKIQGSEK